MTTLHFATCVRKTALEYIQDAHPELTLTDSGDMASLLDLIERDVVRVQDPKYHRPPAIIPGTNWRDDLRDSVRSLALSVLSPNVKRAPEAGS